MSTTDETTPYSAEQIMAELYTAGQPLTSHQLADRLVHGRATPPEWWRVAGVLERITIHNGATVIRFYGLGKVWCYVHRDHVQTAAAVELPAPAVPDLRDAGDDDHRFHRGRISRCARVP